jgi:hypothetical protein
MFKIKLLSNLINHTLKENVSAYNKQLHLQTYQEILGIAKAFN